MSEVINWENLCGWAPKVDKTVLADAYKEFGPVIKQMPVFADTPKRFMLWEITRKLLGQDTVNYPQQDGDCLIATTKIRMADGSEKNIEDVQVGEYVLTHKNNIKRVLRTIKKPYNGKIYTFKGQGAPRTVSTTADHNLIKVDVKNKTGYYKDKTYQYHNVTKNWVPAEELKIKDKLFIKDLTGLYDSSVNLLDITKYLNNEFKFDERFVYCNGGKSIYRYIPIDKDFARLVGLYLAEGCLSNGRTMFCFNSNETDLINDTKELINKCFGCDSTSTLHNERQTCALVNVYSIIVEKFIKAFIPGLANTKRVPTLFFQTSKEIQLELFKGWMDGDGHYRVDISDNTNRIAATGVSISKELIEDMYSICLNNSIKTNIHKRKDRENRQTAYSLQFYGESVLSLCPELKNKINPDTDRKSWQTRSDIVDSGYALNIKEISIEQVNDIFVYCLEVEDDHSFVANGYVVSNCVSFGAKNACEHLQAFQLKNSDKNKWRSVFPPYIYGISRVQIGGGRLGRQAGSLGVWATQGLIKYGCLFTDTPGVPQYAKVIAQSWGASGPPKQFIDEASKYLLKMQMDAAKVTMWEQLKSAISNGYPVTVASSYGFSMKLGARGYHENTDTWPHQMCIIGYDESEQYEEPCVCILNSWGNAHGEVIDKVTNEKWPVGTLRVRKSVVLKMLVDDGGDSWAYSNLDLGFVPRLPESAFSII